MVNNVAGNKENGKKVILPFYLLASFTIYVTGITAFSNSSTTIFRVCAVIYGISCIMYLWQRGLKLRINNNIIVSLLFFLWFVASGVWQYSRLLYTTRLGTVSLILLFSILTIQWLNNGKNTLIQAMKCIVFAGLFTIAYKFAIGEINLRMSFSQDARTIIGANDLAIIFVICTCISIYLAFEVGKKYMMFAVVFASISLMTGSKKAIIGILLLILVYGGVRVKNIKQFIIDVFAISFLFFVIYLALTRLPAFSYLNERIRVFFNYFSGNALDYSTQNREMFRRLGWSAFFLNPIIGYGVSYSTTDLVGVYLHDNYVELAVSLGIIGVLLFYLRHFLILRIGLKKNKNQINDKSLIIASVFLCFILDYAAVTYFDKFVWMFLTLIYEFGLQTCSGDKAQ